MKIRFGILGPGIIAGRFMRDFHLAKDAQMQAVASRDLGRARAFAQKWEIPTVHDSYEALCRDPQVDVVYVATPHAMHLEQALLAMQNGKHVLVEKPVTLNAGQFETMTAAARENGVFLMEAMWTRFFPANIQVRQLLRDGEIGQLRAVQANFAMYRQEGAAEERLFAPELGGGGLLDMGCYPVHYALDMFADYPTHFEGYLRRASTGVDALCAVSMEFPQGLAAFIAGFDAQAQPDAMLMGTKGSIYVPEYYHPRRLHLRKEGEVERVYAYPYEEEGFAYQVQHVCECVRKGMQQSDIMPWADSMAAMRIMDGLRESWGVRYPQEG